MNRTGLVAAVAIGLTATISLFGCTTSTAPAGGGSTAPSGSTTAGSSSGPIQIAFVTNNTANYWNIAKAGVSKAQAELGPGYNVEFREPDDGTAATQKSVVNDLIAGGVKAVAISVVDPANETPWINDISKQISVVTQDSDAAQSARLAYVGTNNHDAGELAGQLLKQALPSGGKVILFVGNKDAQNAKDRTAGLEDAIKGTNIQIIDTRTDGTDTTLAKTNAADMMTAHPDLAAEVGLYNYNGPAIASAVKDAGKIGKVKIVCFDQEDATLQGVKDGEIYGTVVQQPYQIGYQATKLLAQLAKGDKSGIPASGTIYLPGLQVTSKNIDSYWATLKQESK